jgi:hypothetical protein
VEVTVRESADENEYLLKMQRTLTDKERPPEDSNCGAAYHWARNQGASLAIARFRIELRAQRYAQIELHAVKIRALDTSEEFGGKVLFRCGDPNSTPQPEGATPERVYFPGDGIGIDVPELYIPPSLPDSINEAWPPERNLNASFTLPAGAAFDFPVDIYTTKWSAETQFAIALQGTVNGVEKEWILRGGEKPFLAQPYFAGQGYEPPQYRWCPGSPGVLVYRPEVTPDSEPPPDICP